MKPTKWLSDELFVVVLARKNKSVTRKPLRVEWSKNDAIDNRIKPQMKGENEF